MIAEGKFQVICFFFTGLGCDVIWVNRKIADGVLRSKSFSLLMTH